jgi:glycerophosphoryl diester phosphodiesterase
VVIANIVYDAPGNDVEYNDSEYVVLSNNGTGTADVGGWRLTDIADHRITIPSSYVIAPGGELRVYTGPGDSTSTRYFDARGQAIWNNSGGDTATLSDSSGRTVDTYTYSS